MAESPRTQPVPVRRHRQVVHVVVVLALAVLSLAFAPGAASAAELPRVSGIHVARHSQGQVAVKWRHVGARRYAIRWSTSLAGLSTARVHVTRHHGGRTVVGWTRAASVYVQVRAARRAMAGPWSAPTAIRVRKTASSSATSTSPGNVILPPSTGGLSFDDEFDGTSLDTTNRWTRETGGGYGQETYSSDPAYSSVGGGNLTLTTKQVNGSWVGGQVSTRGHFTMNSGIIEFRAKLPTATGFWPGIWVDPSIHGEAGSSTFGEFDILEQFNGMWPGNPAFTTMHFWQNRSAAGVDHAQTQLPMDYNVSDGNFHTWRVVWTPVAISLTIDGNLVGSMTQAQFTANTGDPWPFNKMPAYFIMQLAAMGNGRPDAGYPAPKTSSAQMVIDYVRITKTS